MRKDRNPSQSWAEDDERSEEQIMKARVCLVFDQNAQTLKTSEILAKLDLGKIAESKYRKIKFSFSSLFKAFVLAELERIEKQTEIASYLEQNKRIAKRLGFSEIPSTGQLNHFWNQVLDKNLRYLVSYTAEKIKEQAYLFEIEIELEGRAKEIQKITQWDSDFEALANELDIHYRKYSPQLLLKAVALAELGDFSSPWTTGGWLYRNEDLAQKLGFSDLPKSFGSVLKHFVEGHPRVMTEVRKILRRRQSPTEAKICEALYLLRDNLDPVEKFAEKLYPRMNTGLSLDYVLSAVKLLALSEVAFPVVRSKRKKIYSFFQEYQKLLYLLEIGELPRYSYLSSVKHDMMDLGVFKEFKTKIAGGILRGSQKSKVSETPETSSSQPSPEEKTSEQQKSSTVSSPKLSSEDSSKPEPHPEPKKLSNYQIKQMAWRLFNDGSSREMEEVIAEMNQRFSEEIDSSEIESYISEEIEKRKGRRCEEMGCFSAPPEDQTWGWCKKQGKQRSKDQYICAARAYSLSRGLRRKPSKL